MAGLSIEIDEAALNAIVYRLGSVENMGKALRKPLNDAMIPVHDALATYPPEPPDSSYRRTLTLGRRWTLKTEAIPNGAVSMIGNVTEYKPWVQVEETQVWYHRARGWKTTQTALRENIDKITFVIDQAVKRIVEGR